MTMHGERPDRRVPDDLAQQLVVGWRVRCALRRAPWELTVGNAAVEVCRSIARTLQDGVAAPDLAPTLRAWGSRVPSAVHARAALQCLAETVSTVAASQLGEFRPRGLDPALEQLALESVVPAGRRVVPARIDLLTGCPDRGTLLQDLGVAVAGAQATRSDVTVAVLEVEDAHVGRNGDAARVDDVELLGLLATIRRAFHDEPAVYRVAQGSFAVLAAGQGTLSMGERILGATCLVGPRFNWGAASLVGVGDEAAASPDVLLLLAESDLVLRRQDMNRVTHVVTFRRRLSVVGSAAAALLLFSAVGVALHGSSGAPQRTEALAPAPTTTVPAATVPTPVVPSPGPSPASQPPPPTSVPPSSAAPPPTVSTPTEGPASLTTGGSTTNAQLTSYQSPTPGTGSGTASAPPPPPPPPPPAPTPTPAPPSSTPSPAPGQGSHKGSGGMPPGQAKELQPAAIGPHVEPSAVSSPPSPPPGPSSPPAGHRRPK